MYRERDDPTTILPIVHLCGTAVKVSKLSYQRTNAPRSRYREVGRAHTFRRAVKRSLARACLTSSGSEHDSSFRIPRISFHLRIAVEPKFRRNSAKDVHTKFSTNFQTTVILVRFCAECSLFSASPLSETLVTSPSTSLSCILFAPIYIYIFFLSSRRLPPTSPKFYRNSANDVDIKFATNFQTKVSSVWFCAEPSLCGTTPLSETLVISPSISLSLQPLHTYIYFFSSGRLPPTSLALPFTCRALCTSPFFLPFSILRGCGFDFFFFPHHVDTLCTCARQASLTWSFPCV